MRELWRYSRLRRPAWTCLSSYHRRPAWTCLGLRHRRPAWTHLRKTAWTCLRRQWPNALVNTPNTNVMHHAIHKTITHWSEHSANFAFVLFFCFVMFLMFLVTDVLLFTISYIIIILHMNLSVLLRYTILCE